VVIPADRLEDELEYFSREIEISRSPEGRRNCNPEDYLEGFPDTYYGRSQKELYEEECPVSSVQTMSEWNEIIIPGIIWCQVIRDELAERLSREFTHDHQRYDS
jgi:hypothetical protein